MTDVDLTREVEQNVRAVARQLFAAGSVDAVLQRTVDLAVATIDGCDVAGIFIVDEERVTTAAASDPIIAELDELQFTTGEGPCLEAIARGANYTPELAADDRWPTFGPAASHAGIRSAFAVRLDEHPAAALNLFAHLPAAFGATDRAQALIFATLASLALAAAEERAENDTRIANLQEALETRELIGQAQGVLIERERITGEQAFALLRRASQHLNIKLRDVAHTIVETGQTPPTGPGPLSPVPPARSMSDPRGLRP